MVCFRLASGETLHSYCKKNRYCYVAVYIMSETIKQLI